MFPISKRALATIVAAAIVSVTLLAVPAQAASPRAFSAQDTPTWSIFSWSFWEDAFRPVVSWFQGGDQQPTAQQADGPRSLFDRVSGSLEPNGGFVTAASPSDPVSLNDGSN